MVGSILTAIRTYGASGKHLADGERSMLALFKKAAEDLRDKAVEVTKEVTKKLEKMEI